MHLLWSYLRHYRRLVALALVLAATNQVFSLLDPLIFRHVIDEYATRYSEYTTAEFFRGVTVLLAAAVGVAFVSRVAKNFQDYVVNVVVQRLGARLYADGIRHSLELPYAVFEDQRSGETLGKLQKVRTDVERFIAAAVNVLFTTIVGVVFVMIYALNTHWAIAPVFLVTVPLLFWVSSTLSRKVKAVQKVIVAETTALAGATTESLRNIELVKSLGLADQEVGRLNATTDKILQLELRKVRYLRSLSFIQGTVVNFLRTSILFFMLYLIYAQQITVGQFFSMMIYSFFIFGPLQEMGNVINIYRETEASLAKFQEIMAMPLAPRPAAPVTVGTLHTLAFDRVTFQHPTARASPRHRSQSDTTRSICISETAPESRSTERSTGRPSPIAASRQSASSAPAYARARRQGVGQLATILSPPFSTRLRSSPHVTTPLCIRRQSSSTSSITYQSGTESGASSPGRKALTRRRAP